MRGVYYSACSLCYKTIGVCTKKCLLMRDCLLFRRLLLPESTVYYLWLPIILSSIYRPIRKLSNEVRTIIFSKHNFPQPWLESNLSTKSKWDIWLKDISTPDFSTPNFNPRRFNHELFNPGLFKHEFLNHEKSGVERSGVEAWGWKVWGWDVLQPDISLTST